MQRTLDTVREFDLVDWLGEGNKGQHRLLQENLEHGAVLFFPRLGFELLPEESHLLSDRWSDRKTKNINLRPAGDAVRGAMGSAAERTRMRAMLARYASISEQLIQTLFPGYGPYCKRGGTSFRPRQVEQRRAGWRKDDTRLHVDSFPSNPVRGLRLLRVFSNINPNGVPRVWRVGEPFRDFAKRFVHQTQRALPGSAWLMHKLRITKSRRSEYDHLMLQLHDRVKADLDYQRNAPQQEFAFPPGCTWIVFSDQVLHASMSGKFALEQTYYLDPRGLADKASSPLAILEELTGRKLV